jgi:hypothetical protein
MCSNVRRACFSDRIHPSKYSLPSPSRSQKRDAIGQQVVGQLRNRPMQTLHHRTEIAAGLEVAKRVVVVAEERRDPLQLARLEREDSRMFFPMVDSF